MDMQTLFNIAVGLAGAFGGWILSSIYRSIERLDADVRQMPHMYVSRDDYRDDVREIKEGIQRIHEKLDAKADKK